MAPDQAEIIALQALAFLAASDKYRSALMAQTGADGEGLKAMAQDTAQLGAILDFLLDDERRLIDCCQELEWPPELPHQARLALPGSTAGLWM
jgi:hypothetical protein